MLSFRSLYALRCATARGMSSKDTLTELAVDREGIALVSLRRLPVNSLNLELLQDLNNNLEEVKKDGCKGVVFTSALPKVFSAGMDLDEFLNPDLERLRMVWWTFQDLFLKIYGSGEIATAAAINGHTAAGACVLSLLCDYRVMVADGKSKIGLNDTAVGIVPRPWINDIMVRAMGYRQAEIALTASTMFTPEEALKVNLVDETASDKEDAIEKCKQFIKRYDKVRAETRRSIKASTIKLVEENREEDLKTMIQGILHPNVQEQLAKYKQQLKQKK